MALVPAKCTQCGGNIEVDDTHEAGICQHCGTPFITEKAINNYTTNITNNIVNNNNFDGANIIIENDNLEQLNSRAETFMKLEEYIKAQDVYREITEKYPMDYRGWLGLIESETHNYTYIRKDRGLYESVSSFRHNMILDWFEKAIKVSELSKQNAIVNKREKYEEIYKKEDERLKEGHDIARICNSYNSNDVCAALGCENLNLGFRSEFHRFTYALGNNVEFETKYTKSDGTIKYSDYASKATCSKDVNKNNIESLLSQCREAKKGCYIATCVYGSYDCPQVWTLRRYRDYTLDETWYGRLFIKCYYSVSPKLVKWFGNYAWFRKPWKKFLDGMVERLNSEGIEDTKYNDKY